MTLEEVINKKSKLEDDILALISDFRKETNLDVEDVKLTYEKMQYEDRPRLMDVDLMVRI